MGLIGGYIIFEAIGIIFLLTAFSYAGKDRKQNKEFLSLEAIRSMAAGLIFLGTAFLAFTLFAILEESRYVFLYCMTGCLGLALILGGFIYLGKKKIRVKYRKGQAPQSFSRPDLHVWPDEKKPSPNQQILPDLPPLSGSHAAREAAEVFSEQRPEGPSVPPPVRPSEYLHCSECGGALFPNDQFCPTCGKPVQKRPEKSVPEVQEEPGPKRCRFCEAEIKNNELFCIHCGHRI
ncbi:zinc ribbon domain-containing protein [Lachnospiraceae bacterium 62-35]